MFEVTLRKMLHAKLDDLEASSEKKYFEMMN